MVDNWQTDVATIQNQIQEVEGYVKQRQDTAMMGKSTSIVDDAIKSKLRILSINFQNLERKVQDYEAGVGGFNLSSREKSKRITQLEQLRTDKENAQMRVNAEFSRAGIEIPQFEKVTTEELNQMDTQQIYQRNQEQLKLQDQHLDHVHETIKGVKEAQKNIKEEIHYQDPMIEQIGRNMDQTQSRLVRADTKLKRLIQSSSDWCLWLIIVIEIVAIIVLIVV